MIENYYNQKVLENDLEANMNRPFQQCLISVMDTIADPNIRFDEKGISNYFYEYQETAKSGVHTGEAAEIKLEKIIDSIKREGAGKPYDCITGVSGGVDSTYLTLKAKELGLRPLIVHFDNSWNSELAVKNIQNIIERLNFDLFTLVVDWEEFRDLQLAYLKASVVDIEAVTDHAIIGTLYRLAAKHNIKYILSGSNIVTEATLPKYWIWSKTDHENLLDIHKQYGKVSLKTYPIFNTKEKQYVSKVKKIISIDLLNYLPYNKAKVKDEIKEKLGWVDYGGKHYESVWTRFYQGYILPRKFNIDKRKAHLSNLIFSGQIDREQAFRELEEPIYPPHLLREDYDFVLKKLGLQKEEFENFMLMPRREHSEFKTEQTFWQAYPAFKSLKGIWKLLKTLPKA